MEETCGEGNQEGGGARVLRSRRGAVWGADGRITVRRAWCALDDNKSPIYLFYTYICMCMLYILMNKICICMYIVYTNIYIYIIFFMYKIIYIHIYKVYIRRIRFLYMMYMIFIYDVHKLCIRKYRNFIYIRVYSLY